MKKDAIDLTYALTLPPEKAVAYFRRKGRRVSFDWHSMWKEAHATAFTVANCAKLDVLRDLQLGVRTMLKEGKSEQWFVRTLEPVLRAKGWWGPRDEVNPRTGEVITVQQGSQWRLGLIARQNVQNAVNAGRWQEQWDNREDQPFLRYVSLNDARTRPDHRALHGKVFPLEDPFWQSHYPPNGWNCRCYVQGVSEARLKRRGWKVERSEGKIISREIRIRDRRSGEVTPRSVTGYALGPGRVVWTDAGFDYNAGAVSLADNILRERIRGLKDPALYEQARQAFNNSTARHEGFAAVVEGWQKDKVIRKRTAILGLMHGQELLHARARGRMPAVWWSLPTTVCSTPGAASTRTRAPPCRMTHTRSWPPSLPGQRPSIGTRRTITCSMSSPTRRTAGAASCLSTCRARTKRNKKSWAAMMAWPASTGRNAMSFPMDVNYKRSADCCRRDSNSDTTSPLARRSARCRFLRALTAVSGKSL